MRFPGYFYLLSFFCFSTLFALETVSFESSCRVYSCLPVSVSYQPELNQKPLLANLRGQASLLYRANLVTGQQELALAGFSNSGYPIFFTDNGLLEVYSPYLKLQCQFCLKARFNGRETSIFLPALDLPTVKLLPESVSIWPSGAQYIAFNGKCLLVEHNRLFEIVDFNNCSAFRLSRTGIKWENNDLEQMNFLIEGH